MISKSKMKRLGVQGHCQNHPDYTPEQGEPVLLYPQSSAPCPYCWRARAKWLEQWQENSEKDLKRYYLYQDCVELLMKVDKERIAELEAFITGEAEAGSDTVIGRIREKK